MGRVFALAALCASAGAPASAATVTLPHDAYFEGICTEIRDEAARGRWDRVGEVIRALAGAMDRVGPSTAVWISPSHAMGFWPAFQRLLAGLPEEVRARFTDAAAPVARASLQRVREAERLGALHHIARDLPALALARDAALELLDLDLEEGRFESALSRCERVLARNDLDPRARFSVLARGLACAAAAGDLDRWRAWRPLAAAFDPGTKAADADLRRRVLALPAPATGAAGPAPAFLPGGVRASFSTGEVPGAGGADRRPPFLAAADGERIFLPTATGLACVDRRTRAIDWDIALDLDTDGNRVATVAIGGDGLFVRIRGGVARIDRKTGRIVWRAWCAPQKDGPGLAWVSERGADAPRDPILTPPLLADGRVVVGVVADREGELPLFVCALSPSDGHPFWTTPVGASHAENYLGLGLGGAPLGSGGGRVFFVTGCGAVACVDLVDGALIWTRGYDSRPAPANERAILRGDRWALCPPLVSGRTLVVAPQDADVLFGLEVETGTILWSAAREDARQLVGVRDGKAFVAGETIRAVAIEGALPGRTVWTRAAPAAISSPAGQGVLAGPWLLAPGREGLFAVDAATGGETSLVLWDRPEGGGNLLLLDEGLLSTGFTRSDLYGRRDEERERLRADPAPDAITHLRRAKVAVKMAAGLAEARDEISRWRTTREPGPASPEEDRLCYEIVHMLSVWLDGGNLPPDEALEFMRLRMDLEDDPGRRVAHAASLAGALERRGDIRGALDAWHAVLPLGPETRTRLDERLTVAAAPYVRGRIVRLLEGRSDRADLARPYEERAERELAVADRFATPTTYRRVIDAFPVTQAARRAYWRIAEIAGGQGAPRENLWTAFTTLREYIEAFPDAADVGAATLRIADYLEGLGRLAEARAYLKGLEEARAGDERLSGGRKAGEVARERLALPLYRDADLRRSDGLRLPLSLQWRSGTTIENRVINNRARILTPSGPVPPSLRGAWLSASPFGRRCRDRLQGIVRWTYLSADEGVPSREGLPNLDWGQRGPRDEGTFSGSLYIFHDGRSVVALEAATGLPRWSSSFQVEPAAGVRSVPAPTIAGTCVTERAVFVATFDKKLVALRAEDGQEAWRLALNSVPAAAGGPFVAGGVLLLLAQEKRPGVLRIDPADGTEIGRTVIEGLGMDAQEMISVPGGAIVFIRGGDIACVAPTGAIEWTLRTGAEVRHWSFDAEPDRIYILRGGRRLAAIATATGQEIWSHTFPAGIVLDRILPEGDRIYVLTGVPRVGQERQIAAFSIEPLPGGRRAAARELWRQPVGEGGASGLLSARDAILYCDEDRRVVWAFDKEMGTQKTAEMTALLRFLRGKRPLQAAILEETLIVLSDFGDAGFVADNPLRERERDLETLRLAREAIEEGPRIEALTALGQSLFREGSIAEALGLAGDGILREGITPRDSTTLFQLIAGWWEESSERRTPIIRARKMPAPRINGRLDEWWNPDLAVELDGPARLLAVQAPSRLAPDWRGPEDLSATIYTGWDRDNLYFAVDVRDDHTVAHRREDEEEYWIGDFLLIGLDPDDDGGYGAEDDKLWTLALVLPQRNRKPGGRSEEETKGEFHVRAKDDDSGAIYEVALPWSAVLEGRPGSVDPGRPDPRPGQRIGLSLVAGDDDTGRGTTKTISLTPGHILDRRRRPSMRVWLGFIPERFPRLVLEEDPFGEGNR